MSHARIYSEAIEPAAAYLVGRWFAKCEEAKQTGDRGEIQNAWHTFWFGLQGLSRIAAACPEAHHFAIALSNHTVQVAEMIGDELGLNPYTDFPFTNQEKNVARAYHYKVVLRDNFDNRGVFHVDAFDFHIDEFGNLRFTAEGGRLVTAVAAGTWLSSTKAEGACPPESTS